MSPSLRVLRRAEVERLLPIDECIELMDGVFRSIAVGDVEQPVRAVLRLPGGSALYVMPAWAGASGALATKLVTLFPSNRERGIETHLGVVVLFDGETGLAAALLDAAALTAVRTAAVSAVATHALARPDASRLAILGSGVQAAPHVAALRRIRPIVEVRAWSPTPDRLRAFVEAASGDGAPVVAADSARDAVERADIVVTATSSPVPVLRGEWLAPGAHIVAIGASTAATRELDGAAVARGRLFVDSRAAAVAESGDYRLALEEGAIRADHIAGELGDLLVGRVEGRRDADEITIFKSLGLAAEDAVAAQAVYRRAVDAGAGIDVPFPG